MRATLGQGQPGPLRAPSQASLLATIRDACDPTARSLMHRVAWFAAWRQLLHDLRNTTDLVASRRAAGDGLRSGPGDSELNGGPAARFAAEAARYGDGGEPALRSEQVYLRSSPGDSKNPPTPPLQPGPAGAWPGTGPCPVPSATLQNSHHCPPPTHRPGRR